MELEQIKELANKELNEALACCGMDGIFKVVPGESLSECPGESCSIEYEIVFEYGNVKRTHAIVIGWNDIEGVGLEYGEDGDINSITYGSLMATMYFDMAMTGLDDKYII